MEKYDHSSIEKKWQEVWEKGSSFHVTEDSKRQKEYLLVEFPYPSGDGLHVGHVRSFTAMDVVARKKRAEGKNVLYPIGWDAFGLPTENFALKTGKDPRIVTKENTDNFRRQLKSLGLSFDWQREVNTTDPQYYKWTQWIFLQLYKQGLAYKAKTLINWCPKDKIGLANEEVVDGACERCGTLVEKREKEQWMLAITKYAQRLYNDLDLVDYITPAKVGQRNWIGPSEGAEIDFEISGFTKSRITVFTTRPDTLFGATYVVLAPEHKLVKERAEKAENKDDLLQYVVLAGKKTEIERTAEGKEKTGVEIKGIKAINPANKEEIPIYVADYVLGGYGTGAIMAVPAHDERDFAFAKKFGLSIKQVIAPHNIDQANPPRAGEENTVRNVVHVILENSKKEILTLHLKGDEWVGEKPKTFIIGGIEEGESPEGTAIREILEETGYCDVEVIKILPIQFHAEFFAAHKKVNRYVKTIGVVCRLMSEKRNVISAEEQKLHDIVWVGQSNLIKAVTIPDDIYLLNSYLENKDFYTGEGKLVHSESFDGLQSEEAKQKITEFVGGKIVTTYKLRDWVFSRQRYWGEPIPLVKCEKDGWVPVPEDQLPVLLPEVEKYQPTDTGESPLADIREFVDTTCPTCGGEAKRETDVMPNWAGSSWYYLRYADPQNNTAFANKENLKYWTPVDWYNGGMEHTTLHLLYSRFWHKFLFDQGLVPTPEPYTKRTSHGLILAEDGSKMSKSKGNVVNPDTIVKQFGADSLRLYEMFLGPFDQPVAWNTDSIAGVYRFLERVWNLQEKLGDIALDTKTETLLHQSIEKVSRDIEALKMNTAVSSLMILLNHLTDLQKVPTAAFDVLLQLLAPFAPHVAAELWAARGNTTSIEEALWPVADVSKLVSATSTVAVQVNGKMRGSIELAANATQEDALAAARADASVAKWLAQGREVRAIYVPGRAINFVVDNS